jgi:hypothetical protein
MAKRRSRGAAPGIGREEFDRAMELLMACRRDLDIQFLRIAQMQSELDQIRIAWAKLGPRRANE